MIYEQSNLSVVVPKKKVTNILFIYIENIASTSTTVYFLLSQLSVRLFLYPFELKKINFHFFKRFWLLKNIFMWIYSKYIKDFLSKIMVVENSWIICELYSLTKKFLLNIFKILSNFNKTTTMEFTGSNYKFISIFSIDLFRANFEILWELLISYKYSSYLH